MKKSIENGIYYISDDFRIQHFNSVIKEYVPDVKVGEYCYKAIAGRDSRCSYCPLNNGERQSAFFHNDLNIWVKAQAAETELPVLGKCSCIFLSMTPAADAGSAEETAEQILSEERSRLLQKQNSFMEFIIDGVPGGYHRCSTEEGFPIIYASEKFLNLLGFTKEELDEKSGGLFVNLVHPDDIAYLADVVGGMLRGESDCNLNIHYRILTKDKGYMQVLDTTRVSEYNGEKVLQCVIISEEHTKEKNADLEKIQSALSDALRREQKYRSRLNNMQKEIVDSISCGVYAYTLPDYKLLFANDTAKHIIGCKDGDDPMQALYRFITEYIAPEDKSRVHDAGGLLKNTGDMLVQNYRAVVDGRTIFVRSNIKYLERENGQPYILVTILDTTEEAVLANKLVLERKAYRDALQQGSEFSFLFDVTEGLLHEHFITAHGVDLIRDMGFEAPVSFDELLAKYAEESKLEFADESMRLNFTRNKLIDAYNEGVTNLTTEYYNPKSDLFFRINCLLSKNDETGHIHAAVVADNITEIRKKERMQQEALKAANDEMNIRVDAILNGISGGFKIADPDDNYRYVFISEGAAQLQGYTVDEFLAKFGERVTSNIYAGEGEIALAEANRQLAEKGSYAVKYRVPHKDGSVKWVIDHGKLVTDPVTGKPLYYILMQDITELENRNIAINNLLTMQRQMADSLGTGIFAYTVPQYEVLILNQEIKKMFDCIGCDESRFGTDLFSKIIPEDVDSVRDAIKSIKEPGDSAEYIFHSKNRSGELITFKCITKLLCFPDGQQYILSGLTDISEQEKNEKRLNEERSQYRNALAFGSSGFFNIDLTTDAIYEPIRSKIGEDLTTELGLTYPFKYDDLAKLWFADGRVAADCEEIEIAKNRDKLLKYCEDGNSILDIEYKNVNEDRYYHLMILLHKINGHTNATFIVYDITSTRHGDIQRRAIIDSLGHIFSSLYHLSFNDRMCTILKSANNIENDFPDGCSIDDLRTMYSEKYAAPEFKDEVAQFLDPDNIKQALADAEYISCEFKHREFGWCRVFLVAAEREKNGEVTSVVFAGNVIDKQKQAELAQREALKAACESANLANAAKTHFLANMSHDIRTPMNAIIGMTAIAVTHLDDKERVKDCLSKISISSKHLLGLINEVLDMSKIESGKMELQEEEFNLSDLIENMLTMSKPLVAEKNHSLSISIRGIEHEKVIGDSQRIQQVFMNLMTNAIKYTPAGGKLAINITEKPTNKQRIGYYVLVFSDNGIGMTEEFQQHMFEPFSRATNDSRVEKIQGTGLGMPITKSIVQTMNGDIRVESKLNVGTKITVEFFLRLQDTSEDEDCENFVNLPILVADDDEDSCVYTCEMLSEIGMKSEWVLTGEEAVESVRKHHEEGNDFFAVILDWKMPGMDGVQTTKEIRRCVGKAVPVIILSAYDWSDIELEARAAGANSFISKPLFKSRMIHMFNDLIGGENDEKDDAYTEKLSSVDYHDKRVLLVEDNALNSEIAGEILGMVGFEIEFATNGKEAVDKISSVEDGYYDIVFMDIQMPIMNGYEAARAIRALPRDYTKSVPILAMTANAFAEDVSEAKNAGMNAHIAKPLDLNMLMEELKKWLN